MRRWRTGRSIGSTEVWGLGCALALLGVMGCQDGTMRVREVAADDAALVDGDGGFLDSLRLLGEVAQRFPDLLSEVSALGAKLPAERRIALFQAASQESLYFAHGSPAQAGRVADLESRVRAPQSAARREAGEPRKSPLSRDALKTARAAGASEPGKTSSVPSSATARATDAEASISSRALRAVFGGHFARGLRLRQNDDVALTVRPVDGRPVAATTHGGVVTYAGAYPATDALYAHGGYRVGEYLLLRSAAAPTRFDFEVLRTRGVSALEADGRGQVIVRDEQGRQRITFERTWAVDAKGTLREADLELHGECTQARSFRGCTMRVALDLTGLTYPILVDPSGNGGPCMTTSDCTAMGNVCVDGVCCASACSGTCESCNQPSFAGTCLPLDARTDPASECGLTFCDGLLSACATTCTVDADCKANAHCNIPSGQSTGTCVADLAPGATCTRGAQCPTGNCVDGVCCADACAGTCRACNVAGSLGTCTNIPASTDPGNECVQAFCNGSGACATACTQDTQCKATGFCNGTSCVADLASGATCARNEQCPTGNCVDGVCCADACTGTCRACNVSGSLGSCANVPVNTDPASECGNTFCSGSGACKTTCAADTDCKSGFFCGAGGTCQASAINGAPCTANNQCNSNRCRDNVCCDANCSGTCEACNVAGSVGTCTNIPAGTDPGSECGQFFCAGTSAACATTCATDANCKASGHCNGSTCTADKAAGAAQACTRNEQCVGNANCVDGFCCTAACTGLCQACNVASQQGVCASVPVGTDPASECGAAFCDGAGACRNTCTADAQCKTTGFCNIPSGQSSGTCTTDLAQGATCSGNGQCQSGFCVDGVCCGDACTGTCRACNVAGSVGTCANVPVGTDPASECGQAFCAGTSAACATSCTLDTQCKATGFCNGTSCVADLAAGSALACTRNEQCAGNANCIDGFCCNGACGGLCEACNVSGSNGTCAAIPVGQDPANECGVALCNGARACGGCTADSGCKSAGYCDIPATTCRADKAAGVGNACTRNAECAGNANCVDGFCCDQACGGACQTCNQAGNTGLCRPVAVGTTPKSGQCSGALCDGVAGGCPSGCASDASCATTHFCENRPGEPGQGTCKADLSQASVCTSSTQCTSNVNCVDGVCCSEACAGYCRACSLAGSVGVCSPDLVERRSPEVRVTNATGASEQVSMAAGRDDSGRLFGIAWVDRRARQNGEIYFRRVRASGELVGTERVLATTLVGGVDLNTGGTFRDPVVVWLGTRFEVYWSDGRTSSSLAPREFLRFARLDPNGTLVAEGEVGAETRAKLDLRAVRRADGRVLAVYKDVRGDNDPEGRLRATLFETSGVPAVLGNLDLTDGVTPIASPTVATDGTRFLVAWLQSGTPRFAVLSAPLNLVLDVPPSDLVAGLTGASSIHALYRAAGNEFVATYARNAGATGSDIFGVRFNGALVPGAPLTLVNAAGNQTEPALASRDTEYALVYREVPTSGPATLLVRRFAADLSATLPSAGTVSANTAGVARAASVLFAGEDYSLAWVDGRTSGNDEVYFAARLSCGSEKLSLGMPCSAGADCASGSCAQGVCCESACSGACRACNVSTDALCQSASQCPSGWSCSGGSCKPPVTSCTSSAQCGAGGVCIDGACSSSGRCLTPPSALPSGCAGAFACNADGSCKTGTCSRNEDCELGAFCNAGACAQSRALGVSCTSPVQCRSGFCVDGVCCESACGDSGSVTCQSCNVAGSAGSCVPLAARSADACAATTGGCAGSEARCNELTSLSIDTSGLDMDEGEVRTFNLTLGDANRLQAVALSVTLSPSPAVPFVTLPTGGGAGTPSLTLLSTGASMVQPLRIAPGGNDAGVYTVRVTADDGVTPAPKPFVTFQLTVKAVNVAPVITVPTPRPTINEASESPAAVQRVDVTVEDGDRNEVIVYAVSPPAFTACPSGETPAPFVQGVTTEPSTTIAGGGIRQLVHINLAPGANAAGEYCVELRATDRGFPPPSRSDTKLISFTVTRRNAPPSLADVRNRIGAPADAPPAADSANSLVIAEARKALASVTDGEAWLYRLHGDDLDNAQTLSFSLQPADDLFCTSQGATQAIAAGGAPTDASLLVVELAGAATSVAPVSPFASAFDGTLRIKAGPNAGGLSGTGRAYCFAVRVTDSGGGDPALFVQRNVLLRVDRTNAAPVVGALGTGDALATTEAQVPLLDATPALVALSASDVDSAQQVTFQVVRPLDCAGGVAYDSAVHASVLDLRVQDAAATPGSGLQGVSLATANLAVRTGANASFAGALGGPTRVYCVGVRACDNGSPAACGDRVLRLTVTRTNTAPVLGVIGDNDAATATEPTAATGAPTEVSLPLTASDLDAQQTLTATVVAPPSCTGGTAYDPSNAAHRAQVDVQLTAGTAAPGATPAEASRLTGAALALRVGPNGAGGAESKLWCVRVSLADDGGGDTARSVTRDLRLTVTRANASPTLSAVQQTGAPTPPPNELTLDSALVAFDTAPRYDFALAAADVDTGQTLAFSVVAATSCTGGDVLDVSNGAASVVRLCTSDQAGTVPLCAGLVTTAAPGPAPAAASSATGVLRVQPGPNATGGGEQKKWCFGVRAQDGAGGEATVPVSLTVRRNNATPTLTVAPTVTLGEPTADGSVATPPRTKVSFAFSVNDLNDDDNFFYTLSACATGTPLPAVFAPTIVTEAPVRTPLTGTAQNGRIDLDLGPNDAGTYCVRLQVRDAALVGAGKSDAKDVLVVINATNSAPFIKPLTSATAADNIAVVLAGSPVAGVSRNVTRPIVVADHDAEQTVALRRLAACPAAAGPGITGPTQCLGQTAVPWVTVSGSGAARPLPAGLVGELLFTPPVDAIVEPPSCVAAGNCQSTYCVCIEARDSGPSPTPAVQMLRVFAKLEQGRTCTAPAQCVSAADRTADPALAQYLTDNRLVASGACSGGVCCDQECTGACQSCSDGAQPGVCRSLAPNLQLEACGAYSCGERGACRINCSRNVHCAAARGFFCDTSTSTCKERFELGSACGDDNECRSEFCAKEAVTVASADGGPMTVVRGVCCDARCAGDCQTCRADGRVGQCTPKPDGEYTATCLPFRCNGAGGCRGTCANDSNCAPGYFCDSLVCKPKRSIGQACAGDNQCLALGLTTFPANPQEPRLAESGLCRNGFCCDGACGADCTRCDVPGRLGVCSFAPARSEPQSPAGCQGLYRCGEGGQCLTRCQTAADCAAGKQCVEGQCGDPKENGAACVAPAGCVSRSCNDEGTCCGPLPDGTTCNGPCRTCPRTVAAGTVGVCQFHPVDTDPEDGCGGYTCNGLGACRSVCANDGQCRQRGGVQTHVCRQGVCKERAAPGGTCSSVADCRDGLFCTDGACCTVAACGAGTTCASGACLRPRGSTCANDAECASVAGGGACVGGFCCQSNRCAPGESCSTGACLKVNGQTCSAASQCESQQCVDGVCCESNCEGACRACNLPGQAGRCAFYARGEDPPVSTSTTPPSTPECGAFSCDGAGACLQGCAAHVDCVSSLYCDFGSGRCLAKKAEREVCRDDEECQRGVCLGNKRCDATKGRTGSGLSCASAPDASTSPLWFAVLFALLGLAWRRARGRRAERLR